MAAGMAASLVSGAGVLTWSTFPHYCGSWELPIPQTWLMARKNKGSLLPWLSAKRDGRDGRFVQVGNSLLLDKRFQKLKPAAQMLYICMSMEAGGKSGVAFPHGAARKYGFSDSTFDRNIRKLIDSGFIEKAGEIKKVCQKNIRISPEIH